MPKRICNHNAAASMKAAAEKPSEFYESFNCMAYNLNGGIYKGLDKFSAIKKLWINPQGCRQNSL